MISEQFVVFNTLDILQINCEVLSTCNNKQFYNKLAYITE